MPTLLPGRGGITAGIEDEDVEAGVVLAVATHSVQDVARVDRLVGQLFRLQFLGRDIEGQEVVVAVLLHAVPGEVEEADVVGIEACAEGVDGAFHALPVGIFQQGDGKASFFQRFFHGAGIVERVFQRFFRIGGVADDQREALLFGKRLCARGGANQQEGKAEGADGKFHVVLRYGFMGCRVVRPLQCGWSFRAALPLRFARYGGVFRRNPAEAIAVFFLQGVAVDFVFNAASR